MQGYSYAQLYSALQVWPLKQSTPYVNSLNRLIFLGELRVIRDLDLDIFDVRDSITLAQGSTSIAKPAGSQPVTFTAGIAQGAESATLSTAWTQPTTTRVTTFTDAVNDVPGMGLLTYVQAVTFTLNQAGVTWTQPMPAAVLAAAVVNSPFVVERNLWLTYNGAPALLRKRSYDFVNLYSGAAQGQPKYYADDGQSQWVIAPPADANVSAVTRRYVQRPPSIVVAQNTWIGDNVGDCLFAACLMEAEHWLKADDRYADMQSKYYKELLPNARGEAMIAARSGVYTPLAPVASVPGASEAPPG